MRTLVKEQIVADFASSETGRRMALAQCGGALYREKPFVMGFTEEELENYGFGVGSNTDSCENIYEKQTAIRKRKNRKKSVMRRT